MKLNSSSWHVPINDCVYGKGYSLSQLNGCPYFWGTILSVFIVIPTIIFRGLHDAMSQGARTFTLRYGFSSALTVLGVVYIIMGLGWFQLAIGIGLLGMNVVMFNTNFLEWIFARRTTVYVPKIKKEKRPHMAVEMFKGWKNKHCPRIEWD